MRAICLTFLTLMLAGCGPNYYLVQSRLIEGDRALAAPEVTETPRYADAIGDLETVALRAPDGCEQVGATASMGEATLHSGLIRTSCGVPMFELERALTQAGFRVISWDAVANMVRHDHVAPLRAAKLLGAQVLFQVNALERAVANPGEDARLERAYYHSDDKGTRGKPATLKDPIAGQLDRLIEPHEQRLMPGERASATINANAVWVDTGESIWFYHWTHVLAHSEEDLAEALVACQDGKCRREAVPAPDLPPVSSGRSGTIRAISSGGDPADARRAEHHKLVRAVVSDMVRRFARR